MTNFGGTIFLIIFGVATLLTYLAIRRTGCGCQSQA